MIDYQVKPHLFKNNLYYVSKNHPCTVVVSKEHWFIQVCFPETEELLGENFWKDKNGKD